MQISRPALIALALAAVAGGGWLVTSKSEQAAPPKAEARPMPVVTRAVEARPMPVRVSAVGNVQPLSVVPVRPRAEGEVIKVHIQEGQEVLAGDILFTLDARPAEAARRQAEANLARDRAQLDRARADLARYAKLLETGSATRQKVEQATADVAVLEAAIKSDQAAIDNARLTIDYSAIKALVPGRTGVVNAKLGSLAKPSDAQAMVTITQLRPIRVSFAVAESVLPRIRAGMAQGELQVVVTSAADPGLAATGALTFIDSAIDTQTGTIGLKATFANDDTRLWPGQFVNVSLTLGTEEAALVVPAESVQTGQIGTYVYVVTPETIAEIRAITVDRVLDGLAVIAKGLAAGDKVVVEGQMRLGNGVKVVERTAGAPQ
ncbi:putative multidrug efflux system, subunit A [Magnetospirillum sp. LM-5]|uniref:efflux RND transporter periplasmic adaptor subunit n=1 Tax=Magnetospirillum sp. LM-5 TaxID=2681466 RepID=UPI00138155AE|nr:efflux RND transporter periplasmic adaptor subunit [Magnetospirillum sp. LM-5]CAA7616086.1 putative multidrug efflux system, subunit A [Magnetospirillum sp. LM-5]